MKSIQLIILTVVFSLLSCDHNDDDDSTSGNCDQNTLISSELFESAPSDLVTINSLEISEDCLIINFGASGCDGMSWQLELIDLGDILESSPPIRTLRLLLDNNEACDAFFTRGLSFEISNLQVESNSVLLQFANSDNEILYEY